MPFVPELLSTSRFSNRTSDASTSGSSVPTHVSKPRFLPEPIETTRRSNRAEVLGLESPGSTPSSSSLNSSTPKAMLLNPTSLSSPTGGAQASQYKFLPEPVETTRRSNRTQAARNKNAWSRDSDEESYSNHKNFPILDEKSNLFPVSEVSTRSLAHQHIQPQNGRIQTPIAPEPHSDGETTDGSVKTLNVISSVLPQKAISSQVRDHNSSSGDPRNINDSPNHFTAILPTSNRANSLGIALSGDESGSLSTSVESNTSEPNYLLSSSSFSPSRDFTVIPSIKSPHHFPAEPHNLYETGGTENQADSKTHLDSSPGTIVSRDFAYTPTSSLLIFPSGTHSPCLSSSGGFPTQQHTPSHRYNIPSATPLVSIDNSKVSHNSILNNTASTPAAVKSIRDQVLAAQSQLLRDRSLLSPGYSPTVKSSLTNSLQNFSPNTPKPAASDEPSKRKKPLLPFSFISASPRPMISPSGLNSVNSPLAFCESPVPTTLYYESSKNGDYFTSKRSAMSTSSNSSALSRDTAITTPSTRPSSPSPLKFATSSTNTSPLVQMVCEPTSLEPPNMCPTKKDEVCTEFVVTVFNYISMGHESIARKFDKELAMATGWTLERVQTDRFGALREYVEDYVDKKPGFGSGIACW